MAFAKVEAVLPSFKLEKAKGGFIIKAGRPAIYYQKLSHINFELLKIREQAF